MVTLFYVGSYLCDLNCYSFDKFAPYRLTRELVLACYKQIHHPLYNTMKNIIFHEWFGQFLAARVIDIDSLIRCKSASVNSRRVCILDDPRMLKELVQWKTGRSFFHKHLEIKKRSCYWESTDLVSFNAHRTKCQTWLIRSFAGEETIGFAGNLRSTCTILQWI